MSTLEAGQPHETSLAPVRVRESLDQSVRRSISWGRISLLTDAFALSGAFLCAALFAGGMVGSGVWLPAFAALSMVLLAARGMYRTPLDLRMLDTAWSVIAAVGVAAAIVMAGVAVLSYSPPAEAALVRSWLFGTAFLIAGRAWVIAFERAARRTGYSGQRTLIVGAGKVGQLVASRLLQRPEMGLKPVGFLDKEPLTPREARHLPVLGESWDLERVIADKQVEHVIVAFSTAPDEVLLGLLRTCDRLGVETSLVPRLYEKFPGSSTIVPLGGVPLLARRSTNPTSWQFALKHTTDRITAALALLVLAPLLSALALGILVSAGRPIFYRAERIGRDGRRFNMLKFRSMLPLPEAERTNPVIDPETGTAGITIHGVDRRTPLGVFMRRTSLDELPQLFNVLKGEMSLVGPRPERSEYVVVYEYTVPGYRERHRVKSGITGWAQVCGLRGKTSLADRAEWDNHYIENWSLSFDFKILLLTLVAVFRSGETR